MESGFVIHSETLRGRITTDHGAPLSKAVVVATMAPYRAVFTDTTDANGAYSISVAKGTGDYLLYVFALGHTAFRKRALRTGSDSVLTTDAQLVPAVLQLKTVQVAARKPVPSRGTLSGVEAGGVERVPDAPIGTVSPDQAGDLNTLALMLPGASAAPGGFSVLGLGAAQNSATVNGLNFAGGSLPRDVGTTTRVSTSTFDPARGWFSGANVNVELGGGGLFGSARGHATVDAPSLQVTDAVSASAGQRFSNVRASFGADGPVTWENKHFYNVGAQIDRRTSDVATFVNANSVLLNRVGISPDSTIRLVDALHSAHVPITMSSLPTSRTSENGSLVARWERTAMNWGTFKPSPVTYGILAFGQVSRDRATNIGILATPSRAGETVSQSAGLQGVYSRFFHKDYLSETRSTFSRTDRRETSLLTIPEGRVLVQSSLDDDDGGVSTLLFGGNSQGNRETRTMTWETINTTKFYAQGRNTHAVKITGDFRFDGYRNDVASNPYGVFSYGSVADVASNKPAGFSRTLSSPTRTGGEWNAFAAIGDLWRVTPRLQLLYGARIEGNVFSARPAYNSAVENTFDARTDYAPNTVHVSPRIGFTWLHMAAQNTATRLGPLGMYSLVTPRYLRGGIGEFRGMTSPSLLSDARIATGLSNSEDRFSCYGTATPVPDWDGYNTNASTIPRACAGSLASTFVDSARAVRLIGKGYRPPTSWRANLSYATRTAKIDWSVEGVYSLNLHQPGSRDLNFRDVQSFGLSDDGRPVFVPTTSIVESNGAVSPVAARVSSAFSRVVSSQSDLRSVSRQLTLAARPSPNIMYNWFVTGAYTISNTRAEARGFDGSAAASPSERSWGRSDFDARHQFLAQAGFVWKGITIGGLTRLRSGLPYTPMIAGDINGDGLANDRAFIANPTASTDALMSAPLRTLLNANNSISRCLQSQLGKIASRNSCEGSWSATLNGVISVSNPTLRAHRITNISVNFSNPLAGIDQLVHGSDNLRGWGS
ncbi:MAG: carboxypeptidase-like regulatory domain-containing protein [Gemmatimonadaceae bacterium]